MQVVKMALKQAWEREWKPKERKWRSNKRMQASWGVCLVARSLFLGLSFVSSGSALIESSLVSRSSSPSSHTPILPSGLDGLAILLLFRLGSAGGHRSHTHLLPLFSIQSMYDQGCPHWLVRFKFCSGRQLNIIQKLPQKIRIGVVSFYKSRAWVLWWGAA